MNWIRLILIAFLTLIVLTGAGLLWLLYADLPFLKPTIENYIRDVTEREFAIGGAFELNLGLRTIVVAQDINLGNSEWGDAANLIHIDHLQAELDLGSLLDGPMVINLVEVSGARIFLEESEDGSNNWTFGDPDIAPDDGGYRIVPEVVSIDNVAITYSAPRLDQPVNVRILSMRQLHRPHDDHLDAEIAATINDREIEIHTDIGPFENLLAGQAFDYAATGHLDTLSIATGGFIDDLARPARPAIALTIKSPDVDDLTNMLGLGDYGEGALNLDVHLVPAVESLTLSIRGDLAGLHIEADGSASELQALRQATFRIDAGGPHLGRFLAVFGVDDVPDVAFKVSGMVTRSDSNLRIDNFAMDLGETSLRIDGRIQGFPDLDAANLQFSMLGPDLARFKDLLTLPGWVSGPFDLQGSVARAADGGDHVQIAMVTPLLSLSLDGPLGNPPDYAGTRFMFAGAGADLSALAAGYGNLSPALTQLIPTEPFTTTGTFAMERDELRLEEGRAQVGEAHLLVAGNLSRNSDRVGSRLSFTASGTDLEDLVRDAAGVDIQPTAFELSGTVELLRNLLRIEEVRVMGIAGARIRIDADLGLPIAMSSPGEFLLEASGPDASALPVQFEAFDPNPLAFDLQARGSWHRGRVTFDSVRTHLGDADLSWQGVFDRPPDLSATDLRLSVNVPDLSALGTVNDAPLPDYPFALNAHFDGTARTFVMDQMRGTLGRTTFNGRLSVDLSGARPNASAQLDVPMLDLRNWSDDAAAQEEPLLEAPIKKEADHRAIPDYRLPLEQFAQIDGSLKVSAREVQMQAVTFTDALLSAELLNGVLRVSELDIVAPTGRFDGTLLVQPTDLPTDLATGGAADVHFTLSGEDLQLNLTGETAEDLAAAPVYDLHIDLTGHGATTRELAATLNGHARLLSDGGRIRNPGLSVLFGGFTRDLIGAVNPFSKRDPYTKITCAIAPFTANDGMLKTAPSIMIQSSKINLMTEGTMDLRTEKIGFTFNTRSRKEIGISASELINPYVRVAGTLSSPTLSLDRRGTAIAGGAAAVTGGLSILAQAAWDRTFRAKDPCGTALAEARGRQQ